MKPNSPVQHPERLYRETLFIVYVIFVSILVNLLFVINLPFLAWFLKDAFITRP
jgi:hypothetical protein